VSDSAGTVTGLVSALQSIARGRLLTDEPLAQHTTYGVGGPADLFYLPADPEDLMSALPVIREADVPILPLGGGTNTLMKDAGFRGVVICLTDGLTGMNVDADEGRAEAGVSTQVYSRRCQRAGRTGFEFGCGIPGTIGGAVRGNAGAWGGETFDHLLWLRGVDLATGLEMTFRKEEIAHRYRRVDLPGRYLLLEAAFELEEDDPDEILSRMDRMLDERKASQPLWMRNAGCAFKNPEGPAPAGLLIDRSGGKGMSVGNVSVSDVHANFLVTKGGITAADVLKLIEKVRDRVFQSEGVELETEVRIVGEYGVENV
tara:strand:- start:15437 stop:16381 length:945 start_codon:yes stop_codon:yes gene_type:complete